MGLNIWQAILSPPAHIPRAGRIHTTAEPEEVKPPRQKNTASVVRLSYERNMHKNCTAPGCDKPRHLSKSGECNTTLCTKHLRVQQATHRKTFNDSVKEAS